MKIINGVGLLQFDGLGRMFLLEELIAKPHINKLAGMLSCPLETMKPDESKDRALERMIFEEIGVEITPTPKIFDTLLIPLSEEYSVLLSMYVGKSDESFISYPNDTDVKHFGWMYPVNVLRLAPQKRRIEVSPILDAYFKFVNGV